MEKWEKNCVTNYRFMSYGISGWLKFANKCNSSSIENKKILFINFVDWEAAHILKYFQCSQIINICVLFNEKIHKNHSIHKIQLECFKWNNINNDNNNIWCFYRWCFLNFSICAQQSLFDLLAMPIVFNRKHRKLFFQWFFKSN